MGNCSIEFSADNAYTKINNIDIQIGRTRDDPVAKVEPVNIGGVVVSNANTIMKMK